MGTRPVGLLPGFRFCSCSPDRIKQVPHGRTYAYRHSPKWHPKTTRAGSPTPIRRLKDMGDSEQNTTTLDYQMARRRAQVETISLEKLIETADDLIEQAREALHDAEVRKEKLVERHLHLQALIECAEVLDGRVIEQCPSPSS